MLVAAAAGVILGALVVNVSLEVLRTPNHASWICYGLLLVTLVVKLRPWRWLAGVIAGTVAFGFAVHAIASAWWPRGVHGVPQVGGAVGNGLKHWVLLPVNPNLIGNVAFVILVLVVLRPQGLLGNRREMVLE